MKDGITAWLRRMALPGRPSAPLAALVSVAASLAGTLLLPAPLRGNTMVLFVAGVAVCAWYGGFRAALIATLLSDLAITAIAVAAVPAGVDLRLALLRLVIFLLVGGLVGALGESLRRAAFDARRHASALEHERARLDLTNQRLHDTLEDLRRSEMRFRAIFEHSALGIAILTDDQRFDITNPALQRMLGYRADELHGMPVGETVHPDDRSHSSRLLSLVCSGGTPRIELDERCITKEGHVVWGHVVASHMHEVDGVTRCAIYLKEDISARKRAEAALRRSEDQLRHAQRMESVGRLAGGIAHDFNNLLTVITSYSQLLLDELPASDARHGDALEITRATERAVTLTRQLLTFSRKQETELELLDLRATVSDVQAMVRRLIGSDIEISLRSPAEPTPLLADRGHIEQVLVNLAVNARDAMPSGGALLIETANMTLTEADIVGFSGLTSGDYVMLTVSDTGVGMSADVRDRVFEPFFTTKQAGEGTGLGLSTVYGIVKQSGGDIAVYSEPGIGTTFKIFFPRAAIRDARCARAVTSAAPTPAPASASAATVLLVDDDPQVRAAVRQMLAAQPYEVVEATSGSEALGLIAESPRPIDLVLSDLVMPGMGGHELSTRVRAARPETRVVLMSGYSEDAVRRQGAVDPATRLIEKPFTRDQLLRMLSEALRDD